MASGRTRWRGQRHVERTAFDHRTRSHWAVVTHTDVSDVYYDRVGYNGCTVEAGVVYDTADRGYAPTVAFSAPAKEFLIAFASSEAPGGGNDHPIFGVRLQYDPSAGTFPYGSGCGAGTIGAGDPFAGSEFFAVTLTGAPPGRLAALLVGASAGAVALDPIGMPGCVLNASPPLLVVSGTTDAGGGLTMRVPLNDCPMFWGDAFVQWAYANPGANAAGLQSTRGLRVQVR